MFIPIFLPKGYGENYGLFCKYELIYHCLYVGAIENAYNKLTENDHLKELWRDYQAGIVHNNITVSSTVSELFQNKIF